MHPCAPSTREVQPLHKTESAAQSGPSASHEADEPRTKKMEVFEDEAMIALCKLADIPIIPGDPRNKSRLADADGIEKIVVRQMAKNREPPNPETELVQLMGCKSVYILASDPISRDKIIKSSGIEGVVSGMAIHAKSWGVQEWACAALWNLAWTDDAQVKIAEAGGMETVVDALRNHPKSQGVQENACWALLNLAWNDENRDKVEESGGIELILKAMAMYPEAEKLQEAACGALLIMSNQYKLDLKSSGTTSTVKRIKAGTDREIKFHGAVCVKLAVGANNATDNTRAWGSELLVLLVGDDEKKEAVREEMKKVVKDMLRKVCEEELLTHQRQQTATSNVKYHVQKVAARAEKKLVAAFWKACKLKRDETIDDTTSANMQGAMHVLTDELVLKMVLEASRELSASFRWLSAQEPGSVQHVVFNATKHIEKQIFPVLKESAVKIKALAGKKRSIPVPMRYAPHVGIIFEDPFAERTGSEALVLPCISALPRSSSPTHLQHLQRSSSPPPPNRQERSRGRRRDPKEAEPAAHLQHLQHLQHRPAAATRSTARTPPSATANAQRASRARQQAVGGAVVKVVMECGAVAERLGDQGQVLDTGQVNAFVEAEDVLVNVGGQSVHASSSLSRVLELLAGEAGTAVTLVFHRPVVCDETGCWSDTPAQYVLRVARAQSQQDVLSQMLCSYRRYDGFFTCEGCRRRVVHAGKAEEDECASGQHLEREVLADRCGNVYRTDYYICCNCRDERADRIRQASGAGGAAALLSASSSSAHVSVEFGSLVPELQAWGSCVDTRLGSVGPRVVSRQNGGKNVSLSRQSAAAAGAELTNAVEMPAAIDVRAEACEHCKARARDKAERQAGSYSCGIYFKGLKVSQQDSRSA